MIGHYSIRERLGAGGMGEVYRAHDGELDRDVALKVLTSGSDDGARDRLLREARLASALNHPNICTVYQISSEGDQPFIAMEYVTGKTLFALVRQVPLPAEQALRYASQIAEALAHAHAQGVIHRDLKSSNVMVTAEDRIKVLDFGLAKKTKARDLDADTLSEVSLTESGVIVGTLQYMAPEILRGEAATPASEVWAFGIVLYEMLTGSIPFRAESTYELTSAIMRDRPPELPSSVPAPLRAIVERCLQKTPAQRFASATELCSALRTAASGGSVLAPKHPTSRQLRAGLFVAALVAATVLSWGVWRFLHAPAHVASSVAILPFVNSGSDPDTEYLSDGLTESLIDAASHLPDLRVISRTSSFHYRGKEVDPKQVGKELNVQEVLVGQITIRNNLVDLNAELISTSDQSRVWGAHYARPFSESAALKQDVARDLTRQLLGSHRGTTPPENQETTNNDAYQDVLKGNYHFEKYTAEENEIAKTYFEKAIAEDPTYAPAYSGLADYYLYAADNGSAPPRDSLLRGRAAAEKTLQFDPHSLRQTASLAYFKLAYDWDFQGAERDFHKLLAQYPSTNSLAYDVYAICLRTLGRGEESIAAMRQAVQLDPLSVSASTELGWALYYFRHYDEAIAQFRNTLVLQSDYAAAHFGLALALNQKGSQAEAAAEFEKFLQISVGQQAAADFREQYHRSGYQAALRWMWNLQLTNLRETSKHGYVPPILFADTYALLGDKENAFAWLDKAFEERSTKLLDLKVDPDYDSLRSDPRFARLTAQIGLP